MFSQDQSPVLVVQGERTDEGDDSADDGLRLGDVVLTAEFVVFRDEGDLAPADPSLGAVQIRKIRVGSDCCALEQSGDNAADRRYVPDRYTSGGDGGGAAHLQRVYQLYARRNRRHRPSSAGIRRRVRGA